MCLPRFPGDELPGYYLIVPPGRAGLGSYVIPIRDSKCEPFDGRSWEAPERSQAVPFVAEETSQEKLLEHSRILHVEKRIGISPFGAVPAARSLATTVMLEVERLS
jgi:hypothetical protein